MESGGRAPQGHAPGAAPRVCAHCGAPGYAGAERCHSCGKRYGSSRGLWWAIGIASALILAVIIVLGLVCGSLVGGAGDLARKGLDIAGEELERLQRQSSISQSAFAGVKPGTSRAAVETKLGKPADLQQTGSAGGLPNEPPGSSCLYYYERGQSVFAGPTYRFCFARGRLVEKKVL